MPKRDEGISETGNWNVASDYSRYKIMKPLELADEYEMIARFGAIDLIQEFGLQININESKIKGFEKLVYTLIMLINNVLFAIKQDRGRTDIENYLEELNIINKRIPELYKSSIDGRGRKFFKIVKGYDKILNRVVELKSLINKPLNQNHLIFTDKKEFDPKEFKKNMKQRMIEEG